MDLFKNILSLSNDENVQKGLSFKDTIGKKFQLGMSNYVIRNGCLGEGFEKLTPAQKYFQAHKESYMISTNIKMQMANAMMAKADLMDAEFEFKQADPSLKLRAEAKIIIADSKLETAEITIKDQLRMLGEFNRMIQELEPVVEAQYPEGIEQAEPDSWNEIAKYRAFRHINGMREVFNNLPIPIEQKAKLGLELQIPEMVAAFVCENEPVIKTRYNGNAEKFLEDQLSKGVNYGKDVLLKLR